MFTGIIEGLGTITGFRPERGGRRLTVDAGFSLDGTRIGDSIAVNGACLTVTATDGRRFSADVSPETLKTTTFRQINIGQPVNIERALRLSDRIDGHLVAGHIDGVGTIKSMERQGNAIIISVLVPEKLGEQMIPKGSVAMDGISLTINACGTGYFTVSIIPHTAKVTTIGFYQADTRVNIETDVIGKYVARFTNTRGKLDPENREADKRKKSSPIDMDFLNSTGFL